MPLNEDKFLGALEKMQDRATVERKEQAAMWKDAIDALRKDFRIAGVLMLLTIAALSGIQVAAQNGLFKLNVTPASVHTSMSVAPVSTTP